MCYLFFEPGNIGSSIELLIHTSATDYRLLYFHGLQTTHVNLYIMAVACVRAPTSKQTEMSKSHDTTIVSNS